MLWLLLPAGAGVPLHVGGVEGGSRGHGAGLPRGYGVHAAGVLVEHVGRGFDPGRARRRRRGRAVARSSAAPVMVVVVRVAQARRGRAVVAS